MPIRPAFWETSLWSDAAKVFRQMPGPNNGHYNRGKYETGHKLAPETQVEFSQ